MEFWRWKHEESPFGPSPVLVAEAHGVVIAVRAFLRWTWSREGRDVASVRAVDTVTDHRHRGKGLFRKLTMDLVGQMADEGVGFVFNTPNRFSRPGYLSMGWSDAGRVSMWVRVCRPLAVARQLLGRRASRSGPSEVTVGRTSADPGRGDSILDVCDSGMIPGGEEASGGRYRTPRSVRFIRWRYGEVPGMEYHGRIAGSGPAAAAAVYRTRTTRGLDEVRLCEVLLGAEAECGGQLRALVDALALEYRPDIVTAGDRGDPRYRKALRAAGFIPAPRVGPRLTTRPLRSGVGSDTASSADLGRSAFGFSLGDLELF